MHDYNNWDEENDFFSSLFSPTEVSDAILTRPFIESLDSPLKKSWLEYTIIQNH